MLLSAVEKFNSGTKVISPPQATLLLTPGNLIWTLRDKGIQCNAASSIDAWIRKSLILPGKSFGRPTLSLSSPYATLLLTPGKLLSIQTFLEGQSVIPVLRILLCLQHKHVMNNLKGKYVFMPLGSLSLLGWTFFWNKLFQKGRPKLSLEAFAPINEVADR